MFSLEASRNPQEEKTPLNYRITSIDAIGTSVESLVLKVLGLNVNLACSEQEVGKACRELGKSIWARGQGMSLVITPFQAGIVPLGGGNLSAAVLVGAQSLFPG